MCLRTRQGKKKAKNDIFVYKAVFVNIEKGKWRGLFGYNRRLFPFDEIVENKEDEPIGKSINRRFLVGKGYFHSYSSEIDAERAARTMKANQPSITYAKKCKIMVFKCVIPKGTCYFVDEEMGEYASKNIVVHTPAIHGF